MADKCPIDAVERLLHILLLGQFIVQLLAPELSFPAQRQDEHFPVGKDFVGVELLRVTAGPSGPPCHQSNSSATTRVERNGKCRIAGLGKEFDPRKPRFR